MLEFTHLIDAEAWITIGVNVKESVRTAVRGAGMTPSCDEGLLKTRLARSGKMGNYNVSWGSAGLIISLAGSVHGPDYWQEVWDWSPQLS